MKSDKKHTHIKPTTFNKMFATRLSVALAAISALALAVNEHLFGLLNADLNVNVFRGIMAILLYSAVLSQKDYLVEAALLIFGLTHFMVGLTAMATPTIFGLVPNGYTRFEILLYVLFGFLAYITVQRSKSIRGNLRIERKLVNLESAA